MRRRELTRKGGALSLRTPVHHCSARGLNRNDIGLGERSRAFCGGARQQEEVPPFPTAPWITDPKRVVCGMTSFLPSRREDISSGSCHLSLRCTSYTTRDLFRGHKGRKSSIPEWRLTFVRTLIILSSANKRSASVELRYALHIP